MAFNVRDFHSHINSKNGLARPSLFKVVIASLPNNDSRDLAFQCESTEFTGKSLQTAEYKIYGPTLKVPYQTSFQEITFTFLCTNIFSERQLFENWIQQIMPLSTNNLRYAKEPSTGYLTDIFIYQYNESGSVIKTMKIYDAFPISIGSQNLAWSEDGFHRLAVQFTFAKYEVY